MAKIPPWHKSDQFAWRGTRNWRLARTNSVSGVMRALIT